MPVVILNALSLFGLHGALQTSLAMAAVTGMLFVAIQDRDIQAQIQRQRLVALQAAIDLVDAVAELAGIDGGMHSSHGVGAGHGSAQPPFPESSAGNGF